MDFIRSIINNEELILDEDYDNLLKDIINEEEIDESALDRIIDRVETRNIALYRPIVGTQNLMLARKFLELAKDKKSIPSSITKGYVPAIEMLDDIIQAGPAFVQLFQALHKRAKKAQ